MWTGQGGPVAVAPLFLLYDYSFRMPGLTTKEASLDHAYETGVVCTDEILLHPDPYPSREAWCRARLAETERRLADLDPTPCRPCWSTTIPLVREPTRILRYPEFAQWCGTDRTADWHLRFRAAVAVYGHLHIPRTTWYDGVRFEEVSVGYPREWRPAEHPAGDAPPGVRLSGRPGWRRRPRSGGGSGRGSPSPGPAIRRTRPAFYLLSHAAHSSLAVPSGASTWKWWLPRSTSTTSTRSPS